MEIDFDETLIIRVKLNNDELQDLVSGERLFADLDRTLQLEIYHSPTLSYPTRTNYLNGEEHE